MKKKLVNLLLVCLTFSFTNVYAYNKDTEFTKGGDGQIGGQYKCTSPSSCVEFNTSIYNATGDGEQYFIYCADPGLSAWTNLKVDHILMGSDSTTKAEDYGILTILKNGMWDYGPMTTAEKQEYASTSMALRMYVNAILGWNYRNYSYTVFPAYIRSAYEWVNADPEMAANYRKITGNDDLTYIYKRYYNAYPSYFFQDDAKAKQLLKEGMAATVAYMNDEVTIPKTNVLTSGGTDVVDDGGRYSRMLIVSISLKDFNPTSSYFRYKGISNIASGVSVNEVGYSLEYSKTRADYEANGLMSQSTNLLDFLKANGTDVVYIAYDVSVPNDNSICAASFDVKYEYSDPSLLNGAMLFPASHVGLDYTDGQRFLMYTDEAIADSHKISTKMCNTACDPGMGLPQICKDGETPDADGNVQYEFREAYKESTGQYDLKCILNNTDAASNPYKLVDVEHAGIVSSNPYCSIYCKEDYKFNVPYKRDVDNGRYFRISMSMEGQQDCYSSQINRSAFDDDIIEAQTDIVNNYNEWQKNKELMDAYNAGGSYGLESTGTYARCYKRTCSESTLTPEEVLAGATPTCIPGSTSVNSTLVKRFNFTGTYYAISASGNVSTISSPFTIDTFGEMRGGSVGSCDSSCSVTGYSACTKVTAEEEFEEYIVEEGIADALVESKQALEESIQKLKQIVDMYNGCMADGSYTGYSDKFSSGASWSMIYNYEPEIKYSYSEPNSAGYTGPKWIEEVQGLSCDGTTCDVMFPLEEMIYAQKCDEDDLNEGRCTEVSTVNPIFGGSAVATTDYCASGNLNENTYACSSPASINFSSGTGYSSQQYFNCKLVGDGFSCASETYQVTTLAYIHKVATSKGTYDTPKVYYSMVPSGEIKISNTEINDADRVDGLPVGLDTPAGTYFYILSINNLGKYYSSDQLGRIFGNKTTSLSTFERLEREETINGDELKGNEYACIYTVGQSCTDSNGVVHESDECLAGEDWSTCQQRLCPPDGKHYCVKDAEAYYVCTSSYYEESACTKYASRDEALAALSTYGADGINHNCCPNCEIFCVGNCAYDVDRWDENKGQVNLDFRPITPSIVNPNDRQLGYNWDKNNPSNVLVAQKAGNTISEIEARANLDPETATTEQLAAIEGYTLKVKMTPEMVTWIKTYNNNNQSSGSYNNDTLVCQDYKLPDFTTQETCENAGYYWQGDDASGECVMSNAFCYSEFIDELENAYPSSVDAPKRAEAKADAAANWRVYNSVYLSLPNKGDTVPGKEYEIITNDYWTIYKYTMLDTNGDKVPDIGPAWK